MTWYQAAALALLLTACTAPKQPQQEDLPGELTVVDVCSAISTDPRVAFKCALDSIDADRDDAAIAICEFKAAYTAATWEKLGFDCL